MSRVVYGIQPVREVLRVHGPSAKGLVLQEGDNPKVAGLARLAASRGVGVRFVPRGELDRRTKNAMHQGALVEAPELVLVDPAELLAEYESLSPADQNAPALVLLDGVMDPQNFGAVVRSAVALGAPTIVWPEHGSAPLTPATFRASAGAIEHARLCRVRNLVDFVQRLEQLAFVVAVLDAHGEHVLEDLPLTGPVALVVGAEDKGARPGVRKAATHRARLPMSGVIDSLNASVAAAVSLYEVARQRRKLDSK
jgi:23S rRNA (guanosine2251-2'-O)-methyltransferase